MPKPRTSVAMLRRILQEEESLGKRLLALAQAQSEAIITGDLTRLAALEGEQRQCLEQQSTLELARIAATRDLARTLGMEITPPLTGLLPALPARDRQALSKLRQQLLDLQRQMDAIHEHNRSLLAHALEFVRFSLQLLTTTALKPARYGTNLNSLAAPAFYVDSKA